MVSFPFGLHILASAYRLRHRRRRRRKINFRNLRELTRIVTKREVIRNLQLLTRMALEVTFTARDYAAEEIEEEDNYRWLSIVSADRALSDIIGWNHGLQSYVRELEASLLRMRRKFQGCSVKIYSTDQMEAVEYLYSIGWRGHMSNTTGNRVIAESIDRLLQTRSSTSAL